VKRSFDVAIVGGGAIGSAIAYFLAADSGFDGNVVVIERDPTYARASSALSASSIRQQFSTPQNIAMSRFGFEFIRGLADHLSVEAPGATPPDVGLVEQGYLYLVTAEHADTLRAIHDVQTAEGADVTLLSPGRLVERFPWLDPDGLALGSLGLHGEGWFDGFGLASAFRRKARALGVSYLADEVVGMRRDQGRISSLDLASGGSISGAFVIDAAGPWAREIAGMAGIPLTVEARRRTVFVFDAGRELADCPLVIDPSGAWFRPEGGSFIGSLPPPDAEDVADLPLEVDPRMWEDRLWPLLAARVPAFDAVRMTRAWSGYYEVNTFDHNAILGPHPEVTNLLFANGFSGHGIQHAPAVGRAIAELVIFGRYVSLDLSVFGFERIAAGRPVIERNVIG
jgi:FAD-dependent oxidoreductase domain-containing protein 1